MPREEVNNGDNHQGDPGAICTRARLHARRDRGDARGPRVVPPARALPELGAAGLATTPLYYVSEVFTLPTQLGWDLDSAMPPTTTAGLVQALDDIYEEVVDALRTKDDA
jgi:hypothetical protein